MAKVYQKKTEEERKRPARPGEGRPRKYDPKYCTEVIACGREGLSLTAFAGRIGVSRESINQWMAAYPEFLQATKEHAATRTEALEVGMLSSVIGAAVTARIFALKNADPDNWRDRREIVTPEGGITVKIIGGLPE